MNEAPTPELLSLLYRSAVNEREFDNALDRMSLELASHTVAVLIQDLHDPARSRVVINRPDRSELEQRYALYANRNVQLQTVEPNLAVGQIVVPNDFISEQDLVASEFYRELLQPNDIHHNMGVALVRTDRRLVGMSFCRQRSSPYTADDVRWLQVLIPHLHASAEMAQRVRHLQLANEAAWAVLQRQKFGVQIYDQHGREVFQNDALREIVDRSRLLYWRQGHLDAKESRLSHWLAQPEQVFKRLLWDGAPLAITSQWGDERYQLMLVPFSMNLGMSEQIFVALLVSDLQNVTRSLDHHLGTLYGLTSRECEVAMAMLQGLTAREIAETLHVAESTVVSHRKQIYAKMGVKSQSQLVRILLSIQT